MPETLPAKTQKTENPNLHGFELHKPSSKGTKLLLQVIKAIIDQVQESYMCLHMRILKHTPSFWCIKLKCQELHSSSCPHKAGNKV